MDLPTKKKILQSYLFISVLIILAWLFLAFGPIWHRDPFYQQDIPLKWHEYISTYLGFLIVPAIYGVFGLLHFRKVDKIGIGKSFFTGALIVGIIFSLIAWAWGDFARAACDDHCVAEIPSYRAYYIMAALTIPPLIIAPALLLNYFKKPKL